MCMSQSFLFHIYTNLLIQTKNIKDFIYMQLCIIDLFTYGMYFSFSKWQFFKSTPSHTFTNCNTLSWLIPNCLIVGPFYIISIVTKPWNLFWYKTDEGKAIRKHSLHEKTAASVLLKLFISGNEWCHTTDDPSARAELHEQNSIFKCKQHTCTLHDPWGQEKYESYIFIESLIIYIFMLFCNVDLSRYVIRRNFRYHVIFEVECYFKHRKNEHYCKKSLNK